MGLCFLRRLPVYCYRSVHQPWLYVITRLQIAILQSINNTAVMQTLFHCYIPQKIEIRWVQQIKMCKFTLKWLSGTDCHSHPTASSDNLARLWCVETGEIKREYSGHQKAVVCLAFNDSVLGWGGGGRGHNSAPDISGFMVKHVIYMIIFIRYPSLSFTLSFCTRLELLCLFFFPDASYLFCQEDHVIHINLDVLRNVPMCDM